MIQTPLGMALVVIWIIGALFAAIMNMSVTFDDSGNSGMSTQQLINTGANVQEIQIDTPATGASGSNPLSTLISYAKIASDTVILLARAAVWDFPFFEGFGQTIRIPLVAAGFVFLASSVVVLAQPLSYIVQGLGGAVGSVFNAFLGR